MVLTPEIIEHNKKIKKPYAAKIHSSGLLDLIFSELRIIETEDDTTHLGSRRLGLNDTSEEQDLNTTQASVKIFGKQVETESPIKGLQMYIEPGDSSNMEMLSFKYSAKSFDIDKLSFELLFENPNHVSYNVEPETLKIELTDFRDNDGGLIVKKQTI